MSAAVAGLAPPAGCSLCPRLVDFRCTNRGQFPDWHNDPVPAFGALDARLLVVGLAPGLRGANRTGRPFTGDYAGDTLYAALTAHGFARGTYRATADDGFALVDCRITNAVRCVPPENKPQPPEIAACRAFLTAELAAMPNLRIILALGAIAHQSLVAALGLKQSGTKFAHGAVHALPDGRLLADSYHCSRYNTNTGRLTEAMFDQVLGGIRARLAGPPAAVSGEAISP